MAQGNVKVWLKMSDLKSLFVRWMVEINDYLRQQKWSILNGFDKAAITEAVKSTNEVFIRIENPFTEKRALQAFFG